MVKQYTYLLYPPISPVLTLKNVSEVTCFGVVVAIWVTLSDRSGMLYGGPRGRCSIPDVSTSVMESPSDV